MTAKVNFSSRQKPVFHMLHPHADISLSVASIIMISSPRPAFSDLPSENGVRIAVPDCANRAFS
jgi:hypothetical protein